MKFLPSLAQPSQLSINSQVAGSEFFVCFKFKIIPWVRAMRRMETISSTVRRVITLVKVSFWLSMCLPQHKF